MLLNLISLRHAGAVGAATLVAGGTFSVAAFAQSDAADPSQLASAAVVPDQQAAAGGDGGSDRPEDFFAAQSGQSDQERRTQREESMEQARAAVDGAVRADSGTASDIAEPEPEPEEEPEADSSGGSDASGGSSGSAPSGDPRETALQMVLDEGWAASEFHDCLEPLWEKESNWNHTAENPSSGAYGIPQSLPGDKMASHGSDWRTNPATQIAWGLDYIKDRYGNPCGAWSHSQANNWY